MMNYICLAFCSVSLLMAQGNNDSVNVPFQPPAALYDSIGMSYKISQPIKYIIQHTSVGAAALLGIYGASIAKGGGDEMGIGLLIMPLLGGGIGFVTGTAYGIYRGFSDAHYKKDHPDFFHYKPNYGYAVGLGNSLDYPNQKYTVHFEFTFYPEQPARYFPDKYSILLEDTEWRGDDNLTFEYRSGINFTYLFSERRYFNFLYGSGAGISFGKYYKAQEHISEFMGRKENVRGYFDPRNYSVFYLNGFTGFEFSLFDFINGSIICIVEPIGPQWTVQAGHIKIGNMATFQATIGALIF